MMPGVAISDQNPKVAMRVRRIAAGKFSDEPGAVHWAQVWDQPYNVIVGHEVHSMTEVRIDVSSTGHKVWSIDTGCVHGGRLSAVVIAEDGTCEVVQVQASKVYSQSRE
jgi:bis(5'-nucleosyl)-tetraphosphatase (symmetrical)